MHTGHNPTPAVLVIQLESENRNIRRLMAVKTIQHSVQLTLGWLLAESFV